MESYDGSWVPFFKLFLRVGGAGVGAPSTVMRTYPFIAGAQWDPAVLGDCGAMYNSQLYYVSISRDTPRTAPGHGSGSEALNAVSAV